MTIIMIRRGRNGIYLRLDPERYPGHHDNQTSGDVRMEHEISKTPSEKSSGLRLTYMRKFIQ